ncbi:MFS transporter [Pantoea osteomyelitidis]|uniref:MFS transporter n=1 Tax=Pantoea osteomyelitidis TaxID=3230026 RepID=A0ABW7Q140_9GAMM
MSAHLHEGNQPSVKADAHWGGVIAMTLCVFALVAAEFMPVSLLTPVSHALGVSEGMAGQGITVSGALAVLTSLFILTVAGSLNRKYVLLGMTSLMALSGLIIGLAPNYTTYMLGRALIGIAIGGFWSLSAATAIRLVPERHVARALAIFNGGNALATVVAPPLGSYLGSLIGWRGAFLSLVPVAIVAFIWQSLSLPSMQEKRSPTQSGNVLYLLKRPLVATGIAGCGLFFMGQFTLFTYVRPFLETVTQVEISTLSLILLGIGIAGFVGTLIIGFFLKRGFYQTLFLIPLFMAAVAGTLMLFGHITPVVALLLASWGLVATAAPVGWWTWVARTMPDDAEAGGGLMVAVVQMCIALGSVTGGLAFDHSGYRTTFTISALLLIASALFTFFTSKFRPQNIS